MKRLLSLLLLSAPLASGVDAIPEIKGEKELIKHRDEIVVIEGIYHNPVKGDRIVKCDFATFRIEDHSFYNKSDDGTLIEIIKDGARIRFSARLRFHEERKVLVSRMRKDVQIALPSIQTIRGKEYYVWPSSYSIRESSLIEIKVQNRP